jgi:ATP-dependent DNA helicase RecG
MEKRGEGVPLLRRRSVALSGREPRYELLGENALRLTLYAADPRTSPLAAGLPGDGPATAG